MPLLSRWCIKTGLVYFLTGLLLGVVITFDAVEHSSAGRALWLVYLHLLVIGWITLLIVGVAFWLFPRYDRDRPYGPIYIGWIGYGLLNGGLVLRAVIESLAALDHTSLSVLIILSALAQWLGGMAFVGLLWPRVRSK